MQPPQARSNASQHARMDEHSVRQPPRTARQQKPQASPSESPMRGSSAAAEAPSLARFTQGTRSVWQAWTRAQRSSGERRAVRRVGLGATEWASPWTGGTRGAEHSRRNRARRRPTRIAQLMPAARRYSPDPGFHTGYTSSGYSRRRLAPRTKRPAAKSMSCVDQHRTPKPSTHGEATAHVGLRSDGLDLREGHAGQRLDVVLGDVCARQDCCDAVPAHIDAHPARQRCCRRAAGPCERGC